MVTIHPPPKKKLTDSQGWGPELLRLWAFRVLEVGSRVLTLVILHIATRPLGGPVALGALGLAARRAFGTEGIPGTEVHRNAFLAYTSGHVHL